MNAKMYLEPIAPIDGEGLERLQNYETIGATKDY